MKTKLTDFLLIISMVGLMTSVSIAQPLHPIFNSCADIPNPGKRVECEKVILIDFIYAELWSYLIEIKKDYPLDRLDAIFKLDTSGHCVSLKIRNTKTASDESKYQYFNKNITNKNIHISGFIGKDTCVVYYTIPNHMTQ
ncbi:MAG: hypothetical protein WAU01_10500, partial [Saprospiraceae bacterium]